jgi:hypothetical protein
VIELGCLSILKKIVIISFTRKRDFKGLKEPTLSGHKLQLTTKVKYLGVITDNRLSWNTQLKM